jgi:hypothetical protein
MNNVKVPYNDMLGEDRVSAGWVVGYVPFAVVSGAESSQVEASLEIVLSVIVCTVTGSRM